MAEPNIRSKRNLKLLIVDDDAELVATIEEFMRQSFPNAEIVCTNDGEAALIAAKARKFDVICTDYRMPIVSGTEFVNQVRGDATCVNKDTPVIFITAFQNDLRDQVENQYNMFFITKPFKLENLSLYIDSAMLSSHINLVELNTQLMVAHNALLQNQARLVQSARLSSLGDMSAGISHELNNPLTAVEGYAALIVQESKEPDTQEKARKITAFVDRMKKVLNHLRLFSRQNSTKEWKPSDINKVVQHSFILIEQQLKIEDISWELDLEAGLPHIFGDENLLEASFLNLMKNSREAFSRVSEPRAKKIKISSRRYGPSAVEITYEDNACGILEENLEHVFEPFFTTSTDSLSLGLGLSAVYGVVKQHFGTIDVSSRVDEFTRFVLKFPTTQKKVETKAETSTKGLQSDVPKELENRKPTLLIIDDEYDICDILKCFVESHFDVSCAVKSVEALALIEQNDYDLIVSDVKMPEISGIEILKRVRQKWPDRAMVLMSAHLLSLKEIDIDESIKKNVHFLTKPFGDPKVIVSFLKDRLKSTSS